MEQHKIINDLRGRYSLSPSFKKVSTKVVFLLEKQLELIVEECKSLIIDIFHFDLDLFKVKNIINNEDKLEFISLIYAHKFFKNNQLKYGIHDFLYVQKEIFCQIASVFIVNKYDWSKIKLSKTYNADQDA